MLFIDIETGATVTMGQLFAEYIEKQESNPEEYNYSFSDYIKNSLTENDGTLEIIGRGSETMNHVIIVSQFTANDFSVYFASNDCSVRGTRQDIEQEIKEYIDTIGKGEQGNITIIRP